MKVSMLVAACDTQKDLENLFYEVIDELGAKRAGMLLREAFLVNGTPQQVDAVRVSLSDIFTGEWK